MTGLILNEDIGEWSVREVAVDERSPIALLTFVQHEGGNVQRARLDRGKLMLIDAAPRVGRETLRRIAERIEQRLGELVGDRAVEATTATGR